MKLRILLIERDQEYALFLREVLTEIKPGRFWSNWVSFETLEAACWSEASAIISNESIDVILLDPDLPDRQQAETFRRIQTFAPQIPMILLVRPEDDHLAARMVRDGVQDFLSKNHVDCAPLAHAIRNAIERHKLLTAARAAAMIDSLTGLPNYSGFLLFADRDRKLAERMQRRLMVLVAEPMNLTEIVDADGEQRRDLTLVDAADRLRSLAGPTDLLCRIAEIRFGIAVLDTDAEPLEVARARIRSGAAPHCLQIGAAIFDTSHPASLDVLLEQAALDFAPNAVTMRR
jgi:PleD family two-component response regulator